MEIEKRFQSSLSSMVSDAPTRPYSSTQQSQQAREIDHLQQLMGESLQPPAGKLSNDPGERLFIPAVPLHAGDGRHRKRVLILCTGGG